jgi:hypothetical protein
MQKSSESWRAWPIGKKIQFRDRLKARQNKKPWQRYIEAGWREWTAGLFPSYFSKGFAKRHEELWDWAWGIDLGASPPAFVAVWPRGGGKSVSAEHISIALGLRNKRRYCLYVSGTEDQADKHVESMGKAMLDAGVERAVNKYGSSEGWRRNRLTTSNSYTVDALGLDKAIRGIRMEEMRPDLIIVDDLDDLLDTPATVEKKINLFTKTILPLGSENCAVIFVQNLVHKGSIASKLVDKTADFLLNRVVSGPFKAIEGLKWEIKNGKVVITAGTPTWNGQDIATCEREMNLWGPIAFLEEAQQETTEEKGALWNRALIEAGRVATHPKFNRSVTWADPPAGAITECGIVSVGVAMCDCLVSSGGKPERHAFVTRDDSIAGEPEIWATALVAGYRNAGSDLLAAEDNQGGLMIRTVIKTIKGAPQVLLKRAFHSKEARAEPVELLYVHRKVHHVGFFPLLETEQCTWKPDGRHKSPNRLDALVHAITYLMLDEMGEAQGEPDQWEE